jgi:DNA polymerase-3 subunit alpha
MYLIFDTETTGLPKRWGAFLTQITGHGIQIAWQLHDDMGKVIEHQDYLGEARFLIFRMTRNAFTVFLELAEADGISLAEVLEKFNIALGKAKFIVGQI